MSLVVTFPRPNLPTASYVELWATPPFEPITGRPVPAYSFVEKITDIGKWPNLINFIRPIMVELQPNVLYEVRFFDAKENMLLKTQAYEYLQPGIENTCELGMRYMLKEIIRRHNIIMNRDGQYAVILLRKHSGERCSCYDDKTRYQSDARCSICYGTSWKGGYDIFTGVKIRFRPVRKRMIRTVDGLSVDAMPSIWAVNVPLLHSGDAIVNRANRRFLVQDVEVNMHAEVPTIQQASIDEQESTDQLYAVRVFEDSGEMATTVKEV